MIEYESLNILLPLDGLLCCERSAHGRMWKPSHMDIILFIFICYPELTNNLCDLSPPNFCKMLVSVYCFVADNVHVVKQLFPPSWVLNSDVDCPTGFVSGHCWPPPFFTTILETLPPTIYMNPSLHHKDIPLHSCYFHLRFLYHFQAQMMLPLWGHLTVSRDIFGCHSRVGVWGTATGV